MNILVSQGAVDPWCRGPSRWGWTPCCHAPLHSQCLSSWVQSGDAVVKCPSQSDNTYSKAVAKHCCPLCNAQMPTSRVLPFQLEAAQEAEMLAAEVAKKASSDVEMCGESGSKHTYSSLSEMLQLASLDKVCVEGDGNCGFYALHLASGGSLDHCSVEREQLALQQLTIMLPSRPCEPSAIHG